MQDKRNSAGHPYEHAFPGQSMLARVVCASDAGHKTVTPGFEPAQRWPAQHGHDMPYGFIQNCNSTDFVGILNLLGPQASQVHLWALALLWCLDFASRTHKSTAACWSRSGSPAV